MAPQKALATGVLTSDGRNNWGKAAKLLMKGTVNIYVLLLIARLAIILLI